MHVQSSPTNSFRSLSFQCWIEWPFDFQLISLKGVWFPFHRDFFLWSVTRPTYVTSSPPFSTDKTFALPQVFVCQGLCASLGSIYIICHVPDGKLRMRVARLSKKILEKSKASPRWFLWWRRLFLHGASAAQTSHISPPRAAFYDRFPRLIASLSISGKTDCAALPSHVVSVLIVGLSYHSRNFLA